MVGERRIVVVNGNQWWPSTKSNRKKQSSQWKKTIRLPSNADEIVAMVDGAIVERGPHSELLENDNVYASQWSIQTGELGTSEA